MFSAYDEENLFHFLDKGFIARAKKKATGTGRAGKRIRKTSDRIQPSLSHEWYGSIEILSCKCMRLGPGEEKAEHERWSKSRWKNLCLKKQPLNLLRMM
jgi:hypothetical protein